MLAVVITLALAGAVISLSVLADAQRHGAEKVSSLALAPSWRAAASFGPLTVERVERGGHGERHASAHESEPGADRSDVVRVEVRLANRLDRAVVFSPGQFRLRVRGARRRNCPGESITQPLAFLLSTRLTELTLEFADLEEPRPLSIRLGSLASPKP